MNWKRDLIGGTEMATSCAVSPPDPKGDVRAVPRENAVFPGAGGGCGPRVWHREASALTWEARAARGKRGTQKCQEVHPRGRGHFVMLRVLDLVTLTSLCRVGARTLEPDVLRLESRCVAY